MSKNVRDEILQMYADIRAKRMFALSSFIDALLTKYPQLDSEKYISVERERVREISPLSSAGELIANPTDRILVISKEGKR